MATIPSLQGIPVGPGGKRGPSTGVRIRAKRQRSPWVLSPEQVKLGLAELEIRDQLPVFLEGALGIRQSELGALRWLVRLRQHEHQRPALVLLASRWKPQKHKDGSICKTAADASKPEAFLAGVEIAKPLQQAGRFRIPFRKTARHQAVRPALDLASVLKKRIQPASRRIGITGVGWHTFRHSVGNMLAEMGEHQLTIRDYLRHSNLHVTNK